MEDIDYKILFEASPGLCLILDPDFKIVAVTDSYLATTMTVRENILNRNIFDVFPDNPDDLKANSVSNLRASLQRVLQNKIADSLAIIKYDIKKPESEGGTFEVRYWNPINSPILDSENQIKYIIHRVEDVTEFVNLKQQGLEQEQLNENLKTLAQNLDRELLQKSKQILQGNIALQEINEELLNKTGELLRSNEELSQFAATAAHDIKAPFRSVSGYLKIIRKRFAQSEDPEVTEAFERIGAARLRIASLLDGLLSFAQIAQSNEPFKEVDLKKVLDEVLLNMEYNIKESEAKIHIKGDLPIVKGEQFQLVQLFQNLIANAIKFHGEETPEITISVMPAKEHYSFSVQDNGIGINPKYFNRIFKVFERLNGRDEYSGSGLGLAICQRIVTRHKGKLWVESEVGKGTIFFFTLHK